MAQVDGLRPFREDRPDVSRKGRGRVIPRNEGITEMPRLSPQARPVDTYARPQAPMKDDRLARLSDALSGLNPALVRLGNTMVEQEQGEDVEYLKKVASTPTNVLMQKLKDGSDPELTEPLFNAKNQQLIAARVANHTLQESAKYLETTNRDGLDVDAYIAKTNQEVLATYGGEGREHFAKEYLRLIAPGFEKLKASQVKYEADKANTEKVQDASDLFKLTIDNAKAAGKSPDEIAKLIRGEINGNRILAGLDPRQQEAELLNQARVYADAGDVDLVRALVNSKGTNGISLLDNREHGVKAAALLAKADDSKRENARKSGFEANTRWFEASLDGALDEQALLADHKANPGRMTDEFVRSLIARNRAKVEKSLADAHKVETEQMRREAADKDTAAKRAERRTALIDGSYHRLGPTTKLSDNGDVVPVDWSQNRKLAVDEWLDDSRKYAEDNNETPQQRFQRELPIVSRNGFVHPEWKGVLENAYRTISVANINEGPPPQAAEALAMYKEIHAKAPNLIPDLVDGEAAQYLEIMRVATEDINLPVDKASVAVMRLMKDPVKLEQSSSGVTKKDIDTAVRRISGNSGNPSYVAAQLSSMARIYAGLGSSPAKSVELARNSFESNHININGRFIEKSNKLLPPNAKELILGKIKEYADKHGKAEGFDADDLSVEPASDGTGAWIIVDERGVAVDNKEDRTFTLSDLFAASAKNLEDARTKIRNHSDDESRADMVRYQIVP